MTGNPGTVLITGTTSGVGLNATKTLVNRGWTVITANRSPQRAAAAADDYYARLIKEQEKEPGEDKESPGMDSSRARSLFVIRQSVCLSVCLCRYSSVRGSHEWHASIPRKKDLG